MKSLFLFFILFGGWSVEGSVGVVRGPVRRWSADWSAVGVRGPGVSVFGSPFFGGAKTSLSLPAKRLSCLYVQWFVHVDALCKEGLLEKCVLASKFLLYRRSMNSFVAFFN